MFFKVGALKNSAIVTGVGVTPVSESLSNKVASLKAFKFIKKEAPTQMSSCEYGGVFKKSFFYRTPPAAASAKVVLASSSSLYFYGMVIPNKSVCSFQK